MLSLEENNNAVFSLPTVDFWNPHLGNVVRLVVVEAIML